MLEIEKKNTNKKWRMLYMGSCVNARDKERTSEVEER